MYDCRDVLYCVPESDEGDPQEESQDTPQLCHQGAEGVDKVLSLNLDVGRES